MTSTGALRAALLRTARQARLSSTTAGPSSSEVAARRLGLPPEKLRALISIYHDAGSFITKENLDKHIDHEFSDFEEVATLGNRLVENTQGQYAEELERRRLEPRFGSKTMSRSFTKSGVFGHRTSEERERRVASALFGTDLTNSALPGLELLKQEQGRIQKQLQEHEKEEAKMPQNSQ